MASSISGTLKQRGGARGPQVVLAHSAPPTQVVWAGDNHPAEIRFADGVSASGACIRCPDAPCLQYRVTELTIGEMPAFPGDADSRVCPTDALTWPTGDSTPAINPDLCIGCGLCVRRCPVAAIHLLEGIATLAPDPSGPWREADQPDDVAARALARQFFNVPRTGSCATASEANLQRVYRVLTEKLIRQDAQFPNHLARNLLIGTGHTCTMRRRGDVNIRMDLLIGVAGSEAAVGEVEADANAMIDTPRNILDDVAVILARYGVDRKRLGAVIVGFGLPNQRSEYWQIIEDIAAVTGLRINTLTVGALIMAVWAGKHLPGLGRDGFYAGSARTIRPSLEAALGQSITLSTGFLGILESQK